jgi:hypothetical protein
MSRRIDPGTFRTCSLRAQRSEFRPGNLLEYPAIAREGRGEGGSVHVPLRAAGSLDAKAGARAARSAVGTASVGRQAPAGPSPVRRGRLGRRPALSTGPRRCSCPPVGPGGNPGSPGPTRASNLNPAYPSHPSHGPGTRIRAAGVRSEDGPRNLKCATRGAVWRPSPSHPFKSGWIHLAFISNVPESHSCVRMRRENHGLGPNA